MPIYQLNPVTDPRWKNLSDMHPKASVFHSPGWIRAIAETYNYEPMAYTTSEPAAPLKNGLAFSRVCSVFTGKRLVSLPFSDHCEPLVDSEDELGKLLSVPQEELRAGNWKYIELRFLDAEHIRVREKYEEYYFLHLLDLNPPLEELYKNFHVNSIRRKIQRARREKLVLDCGTTNELLADFYKLHVITRQRQHLPPHPIRWFRQILASLGTNAMIRVARKDKFPIAAIMSIGHNRKMVYKYGCSDARLHNLGGMPFVFWDMIRDAKQRGYQELDLGRSECNNSGLVTFKDRWGTRREKLIYMRYPLRQTRPDRESLITKIGKQFFAHCPEKLLPIAGNILYPHAG